jgi:hypothetical protein
MTATVACADSWEVSQALTVSNNIILTQTGGSNSTQAINAVNLGSSSSVRGSQTVTATGHDITLSQDGSGTNNTQAANLIIAGTIGTGTANSMTQSISAANVTLDGSGSNNTQALNMAKATTTGGLSQTITLSGSATFTLPSGSSNNIQAGNYLNTDDINGDISQVFEGTSGNTSIAYTDSGTNNLQAGNVLIRKNGGSLSGTVTQRFNADLVTINGSTPQGSTQAANYFKLKS